MLSISIFALFMMRVANCENLIFEPAKESFEENESVLLICKPEIETSYCKWYRRNQEITCESNHRYKIGASDTCTLNITSLAVEDDSWWSCSSENSSLTYSKRLAIDVKSPELLIPLQPVSVLGEDGKTADLQCLFDLNAQSCYWLKDNKMIAIRGRYQYIGNKKKGNCSIRVDRVNFRDGGQWQCCYPMVDNKPVIESSVITLNITVVPRNPVITFNGLKLENGTDLFISTEMIKSVRRTSFRFDGNFGYSAKETKEVNNNLTNTILCWSLNGFPVAQLSWVLENENGMQISNLDNNWSTQNTWDAVSSKNLKTINIQFRLRKDKFNGIQTVKVTCNAAHPSYQDQNRTAFMWLTWANRIIENVVDY